MHFIHIEPSTFEGFLKIFDSVYDNGNVYFHLEEKGKKLPVMLKDVCDMYETSGWGLFSFAHSISKLQDKIDFKIVEENGNKFVAMKLAPFLGLPGGNDFESELNDLEDLLVWIKEKSLENPKNDLRIILDAVGDKSKLRLYGKNTELTNELETEMFEKINSSEHLTQWVENQKEGIINAKGRLFDLMARFPTAELMDLEERTEYYKKQEPIKKETPRDIFQSKLRKNRFRR